MKKIIQDIAVFTLAGILGIGSAMLPIYAANNTGGDIKEISKKKIVKSYEFVTNDKDVTNDPAIKDVIEYNGSKYKLQVKDMEIDFQPLVITKKYTSMKKEDIPETIKTTVAGKEYTLKKASEEVIKKDSNDAATTEEQTAKEYREYGSSSDIPESIDVDGVKYDYETYTVGSRTENFSAPAVFLAARPETTHYLFNGQEVIISGGNPVWSGYNDAVKSYLGLPSNAQIDSGSWSSGFVAADGGGYTRSATYTGTRTVPIYTASFINSNMNVKVKYAADGKYIATATCVYVKMLTKTQKILVGAGILLLGLVISVVLFFLRRKKEE